LHPAITLVAALLAALAAWLTPAPRSAWAQDVEVPILVIEQPEANVGESDSELDLANLVTSAAKGVTTVQEAPAIVTILPGEEIYQRKARTLDDLLDGVPGFIRVPAFNNQFPTVGTRGIVQSILYLRDGISLFDTWSNVASLGRQTPVETIKRVEIITGPGGVLWGANSYMGVVNVIYKDAEDIDGIEANASYSSGDGNRFSYRGYVLAGDPELFGKPGYRLVAHASFDSHLGIGYERPSLVLGAPNPAPNTSFAYGPILRPEPARSTVINVDGKLSLGRLDVYWSVPFVEQYMPFGFQGSIARNVLPEDDLRVGDMLGEGGQVVRQPGTALECAPLPTNREALAADDRCVDRNRSARNNRAEFYDRHAALQYRARITTGSGLSLKLFAVENVRDFAPLLIYPAIPGLLEGGLTFNVHTSVYRVGGAFDSDVQISEPVRLLAGVEGFHEWVPDRTTLARGGPGTEAVFPGPYDLGFLPFACPRTTTGLDAMGKVISPGFVPGCPVTHTFQVSRTTLGGYVAARYKPSDRLMLDGGVRLQAAPSFGTASRGYGLNPTVSVAAVYEIVPDWHIKANYAQGFRAPVFNNTDSNGEAVQIDGDTDLELERSDAIQLEVNARLLRGRRRIRELNFRADYTYSRLQNLVTFNGSRYANGGDRGVHSAEALFKLYLRGGHRFELGWTWADISLADKGAFVSTPEHWFTLAAFSELVPGKLSVTGIVKVIGAFEDPNRRVDARGLTLDPLTGSADPTRCTTCNVAKPETVLVQPYELVVDRAPPAADLQLSLVYRPIERLDLTATLYNAVDNKRYSPDIFNDYSPRNEITPALYEPLSFLVSATYTY
jgi:outer membrane receptor protein involved in Fe transport